MVLPVLITVTTMLCALPLTQLAGTPARLYRADQTAAATLTLTGDHCWNQNSCSLIISASSTIAPILAGAVQVTFRVTLAPGARSAGNPKALLFSQYASFTEPPARVVKWRSRSTFVNPIEGQVETPALVTVTGNVWLWPATQLVG